jgi:two-component system chemotaxis response regulator CheY
MIRPADLDVLIVDDHETMRALLARVLAKAGVVKLRTAVEGADALALLAERPASLILADQNMPGMNGLMFVKAVRADPAFSAARIIIVSGHTSREQADAARAAGADAVLVKPVSARDLLAAIETLFAV